jgi:4-oxalocrotonate tautomerase
MPLARIDLPAGKPADYGLAVADVVYEAMIATLNAPKNDRFQVISEHTRETLLIDPSYLGIERSADALIIQLTLNEGRTVEVKNAFYKAVADGLHDRVGLRREDVFISLVDGRSFANTSAMCLTCASGKPVTRSTSSGVHVATSARISSRP